MMSDGSRYDLLYVGVVGDGELVALMEKAFGVGGTWREFRNSRGYYCDSVGFWITIGGEAGEHPHVTVDALTVGEQQQRALDVFDRLAAADASVALTLVAEDDSVVRRRPAGTRVA